MRRAYLLHVERDVRNVLHVTDLPQFNRFLRACALRTSQVLNYSDLACDTGIAPNTARKWLGPLQASAVVALIEPYFGNRTKRLRHRNWWCSTPGWRHFLPGSGRRRTLPLQRRPTRSSVLRLGENWGPSRDAARPPGSCSDA